MLVIICNLCYTFDIIRLGGIHMELWTPEHLRTLLPATIVMILIAVLLRYTLGNREWKIRMIPLQIIAVLLFLMEIGKQVLSLQRGYDLYHLPFHFCSLFIFMMPLAAFYRGKHKQTVLGISAGLCTSVMLLMLIYPSLIYSADNIKNFFSGYFDFHTVAFHNLVLFAAILFISMGVHTPTKKGEPKAVVGFIIVFCLISATMAQLLQTNFNNFYSCNSAPLENLRISLQGVLGYGLTQAVYIVIVTALNIFFVLGSYWLYRGLRRLVCGK